MMLYRQLAVYFSALLALALIGSPAWAVSYTDVTTGGVVYDNMTETSTTDTVPLLEQPTGVGADLVFSPSAFNANGTAGASDITLSTLKVDVSFNAVNIPVESLLLQESGFFDLTGPGGSSTGGVVGISGSLQVINTISGLNLGHIINFTGTVTPSYVLLPGGAGVTAWSGNAFIDIAAEVPDATLVRLTLNNQLSAFSEATSTTYIQKDALTIIPTPEPNTLILIGGGLFAALLGTRERRGSLS